MRRFFILAMLLLFTAQGAWAALSSYCQHEEGVAAQHIGHHTHQHKVDDKSKGSSSSVVDNDCATCHLGGLGVVPGAASVIPSYLALSENIHASPSFPPSINIDRPERPKWERAV